MRAALALVWMGATAALAESLPIYFEDDHAGSFFHLAATLDLDEPHALLLIDEHSDASAVRKSDDLRDGLRRVRSLGERAERLDEWRRLGRVQAFSWIEPLMPMPFEGVWWLAPEAGDQAGQLAEAREQLDGRLAIENRRSGSLADRFHRAELADFSKGLPRGKPVVVSIDLDYFARMTLADTATRFEAIWARVLNIPKLRAVTFSISRPWLTGEARAHRLLERALRAAVSVRNSDIRFEPFAARGPDRSERAKAFFAKAQVPPRYSIETAPPTLRGLLLSHSDRILVRNEPGRWTALLDRWRAENGTWRIVVDDVQPSTDEVWRLREPTTLRVRATPRRAMPLQVRWLALRPESMVSNVLPDLPAGKIFARTATPYVRDIEHVLTMTEDGALAADSWRSLLDGQTGFGTVRLVADIREEDDSPWQRTPEIEIRVSEGPGFRAALAEQFGTPYVFGAGFLSDGRETGPETRAGNDCANYLIYAWRRCGQRLPWCDPLQLRPHLQLLAKELTIDSRTPIDAAMIERGLVIHCGKHVAAIWEDVEPIGVLDPGDIVTHHLSGPPELITLMDLISARPQPEFDLMILPAAESVFEMMAGGDICLKETATPTFPEFLAKADIALANLECALTTHDRPVRDKTYLFKAPPEMASHLKKAGFDAVSLANNHSGDYGEAGLRETLSALADSGLGAFGLKPWRFEIAPDQWASALGINFVENDSLEADKRELVQTMAREKANGHTVLVFPHWGREHTGQTNAEQRSRARWLIDQGADLVLGAGPHCRQPLDFYRGRPVFYSLGNAYFPPRGAVPPEFHTAYWARIGFDGKGQLQADWLRTGAATTDFPIQSGVKLRAPTD
ncbi:MAG: CapA family protein [Verrucomicrobiota bacterium]